MREQRVLWASLLAVCAVACGPAPSGGDGGDAGNDGAQGATCTVDPALVRAASACRADDHCPCGAHCELGRCVAQCGPSLGECPSGQRCDRFGYCRGADAPQYGRPTTAPAVGTLVPEDLRVDVPAAPMTASVRVRATRAAAGPVRVTVEAPFEVQCEPMGPFARECAPSELAMNATRAFAVRLSAGATVTAGQVGSMRLYWGAHLETVALRVPTTPMAVVAATGTYRGTLSLVSAEFTGPEGGTFALPEAYAAPITVDVFSATQLVLRDPLQTLSEDAALTGAIQTSGADQTVSFARRSFWRGSSIAGAPVALTSTFAPSPMRFAAASGALSFELLSTIDGLLAAPRGLRLRYRVRVEREGALAMGATMPAAQTDVALPTIALDRTPWEALSLRSLLPASAPRSADALRALIASGVEPAPVGAMAPAHEAQRALDGCAIGYAPGDTNAASWSTLITAEWPDTRAWSSPTMTLDPPSSVPSTRLDAVLANIARTMGAGRVANVGVNVMRLPTSSDLPCEITMGSQDANTCIAGAEDYGTVDRCAEFAQTYGCVPVALVGAAQRSFTISAGITGQPSGAPTTCTRSLSINARVTRTCVAVAPSAGQCADLLQCARTTGAEDLVASALPARVAASSVSGELGCSGASNTTASPADAQRDLGAAPTVSELALQCVLELERLRVAPPSTLAGASAPDRFASALAAGLSSAPRCIDAVRTLGVLGFATEVDRLRGQGMMRAEDLRASRRAMRSISRWIDAIGTIVTESAERQALPPALRMTGAAAALPSGRDALHIAADGWDLLLHPRFATALAALPGAALAQADWRRDWVSDPNDQSSHTQREGVLLPMLRLLQSQAELGEELLRDAAFRRDRTVLDYRGPMSRGPSGAFGRALRAMAVGYPMVSLLEARARAAAGMSAPAWSDAITRARTSFAPALGRMIANGRILLEGGNPIGVEDSDLPLYFFGTERAPSERFSAISSYLIGNGAGSSGWATIALDQLRAAEGALSSSVAAQADRQYRATQDTNAMNARLDEIRTRYGARIESLCGLPPGLTAQRAIEEWRSVTGLRFDASQCYTRREQAECRAVYQQDDRELTAADINYRLCLAQRKAAINAPQRFVSPAFTALGASNATPSCANPVPCAAGDGTLCTTCGSVTTEVSWALLESTGPIDPAPKAEEVEAAQRECRALYPTARSAPPSQRAPETDPYASGRCYRGAIGDQVMTLRAAATDLLAARSAFQERLDAYDNAVRSCTIQQDGSAAVSELMLKYNAALSTLRGVKTALDSAALWARGNAECYYMAGASVGLDDVGLAALPIAVGCGLTGVAVYAEIGSLTIGASMEGMKEWYQRAELRIQTRAAYDVCINDANQHLIGMRTAALQAVRAQQDQFAAAYALRESIESAQRAFDEGTAELADARASAVRAPSFDTWQSTAAREYRLAFNRARRFLFLAARAVEYEFQQSSTVRYDVLGASTRAELEAALNALRTTSATGSINGAMPGAARAVLSLRDHLLQLEDRTAVRTPGVIPLSPSDRFRLLLRDERFVVRDATGAVTGVQLPFSITPLGRDGAANPSGTALLAGRGCAERLWSVNASVLGAPGRVVRGSESTFTEMDLLKRNTFFSQWCAAPSDGPAVQSASVRPTINLFREPESGVSSSGGVPIGGAALGASNATQLFTRAQMQPRINVSRADFEDDRYSNGQTSQLAARGLYGDYALFIPSSAISRPDGSGGFTPGLDLDQVDDILLRVDYVTVPR